MWNIEGWINNKRRNRLVQPSVEKTIRVHHNLVLRKGMLVSRQEKVVRAHGNLVLRKDIDDADDDDIDSDCSTTRQDQHRLSE